MAAVLGLSAILMTSALAFEIVSNTKFAHWQGKVVGTIYIGLGLQLIVQTQNRVEGK